MGNTTDMVREETEMFIDTLECQYVFVPVEAIGAGIVMLEGHRIACQAPISFAYRIRKLTRKQLRKAYLELINAVKDMWPCGTELYWRKTPALFKEITLGSDECTYTLRMRIGAANV